MKTRNNAIVFKSVPHGLPVPGQHLVVEDIGFDATAPAPPNGLIVEVLYLSLDPYQRQRMIEPGSDPTQTPFTLGQPIDNFGIAKILKSNVKSLSQGDVVEGFFPFSEYASIEEESAGLVRKLNDPFDLDIKSYLGALGATGLTAYSSLYAIGKPKRGEALFVSAASGAVGQIVGQLAKREGLTVIGSVGNDEKLDYIIKTLGFDAGFNYKKETAEAALPRLAPQGIDIYYDNVGGEQLDAALINAKNFARFVMCGMVSQYPKQKHERYGVKNMLEVVERRITMRGFIQSDDEMGPAYEDEHRRNLGKWIKEGSFKVSQTVTVGIANAAQGFASMLEGGNLGKAVLIVKAQE